MFAFSFVLKLAAKLSDVSGLTANRHCQAMLAMPVHSVFELSDLSSCD